MSAPAVRLWLARHGETEWSRTLRHTGRSDVPLTDRGREQAAALRPRLQPVAWDAVLCSPLSRARETLDLAVPGARPELTDDLRERDYGEAEGITTEELRRDDPTWDSWRTTIPGAETIDDVGARADRAIARALDLARAGAPEADDGADADDAPDALRTGGPAARDAHHAGGPEAPRNALLVAHGHLLRILAARWLGQPAVFGGHLVLDVGTVSVLGHERERPAIVEWNGRA